MPIDFDKLGETNSADNLLSPREIFSILPQKSKKYQYLRDVQAEVLNQWFDNRDKKDLVLKMNTGSGKTIVGLLILKSCLNESKSPSVYISPDPYLANQALSEAKDLGLEVTEDPKSLRFNRGNAILITTIKTLINGKSVFGVGDEGVKIPIGSLIIDDSHACLASSESQFTLAVDASKDTYKRLFEVFKDELYRQSPAKALEVDAQDPSKEMLVPYWTWIDNISEATQILFDAKDTDELKFVWPLLKENLYLASCVFGGGVVEISLRCLPIEVIPSFVSADRRIFMSATLSDDSLLISHFNIRTASIENAITPSTASDIGDRMIIVPQELNPDIGDDDLKSFFVKLAKTYNVVIFVPSHYRASYWRDVANKVLTSNNLIDGVNDLKNGHVGLVVVVNKYDGIDLPYDACRILVIDGLPDVRRKIDKIEQAILSGSEQVLTQLIQRIEQGMGRGIRANDDHCVVFLIGKSLTSKLYAKNALSKFTPATRAQIDLSDKLSEQLRGKDIFEVEDVIKYSLEQNTEWLQASRSAVVHLKYNSEDTVNPIAVTLREAFEAGQRQEYLVAINAIQNAIDNSTDSRIKGWLKQQLATYVHFTDPVKSQVILRSAINDNRYVLRPIVGIDYRQLRSQSVGQSNQCLKYLSQEFSNANTFILTVNGILDDLVFRPETSEKFEKAFYELSFYLGFNGQRPEAEFKQGPDVLWEIGELQYLIIECKNGVTTNLISKKDCDQLSGSMNWFLKQHDSTCSGYPIMIHPVNSVKRSTFPHSDMRIITTEKLRLLKINIRNFIKGVAASAEHERLSVIKTLLENYGLTAKLFVSMYSVNYRKLNRNY